MPVFAPARFSCHRCLHHPSCAFALQIVVPNTQRYAFSRHTGVAKNVLPEGTELQVTTTLIVDPHTWQVSCRVMYDGDNVWWWWWLW